MINVAIIGMGKMGILRKQVLSKIAKTTLVHQFEPHPPAATDNTADSFEDIIADSTVDAVIICAPNRFNKPYAIAALKAGKHVFCEKPPAFTAADVQEIMAEEEKSGKKLMYGFNHRFHGSMLKIKELIDAGDHGRVIWMRGRYGKSVDKNLLENWRMSKELAGGGILLDQGIHMLDLMLHFADGFDVIQSIVSNVYWNLDIEDNVFANMLNTQNNIAASLHSTMTQWRHLFSLEIFLEKGHYVVNGIKTSSNSYGKEVLTVESNTSTPPEVKWGPALTFEYPTDASWELELQHFFHSIQTDSPVQSGSSRDALRVMEAVDQIYRTKNIPGRTPNEP